ncbi:hypothetical protein [Ideonella sp. YS5]|uniref:hypothetical protein n=1 Tax=Ideonella sp. YS5 TaxID=3453714 RepID=UPI003EEA3E0C
MTTIGPAPELTAYLRTQLSALARPAGVSGGNPAAGPQSTVRPGQESRQPRARKGAADDLATSIARKVAGIDKRDPDRRRKAFRAFLEALMVDEWGPALLNDPGFQQLVDTVQAQMESQAALKAPIEEAADRLLGLGVGT